MLKLSSEERRSLRARAHSLNPVVSIATNGLTDAVMKEIDQSLKAHELIKVRVYNDNREEREAHLQSICDTLGAAAVQHIGKLLVLWRPAPEETSATGSSSAPLHRRNQRAAPRRTKRSFQA
jgi:putative YhbY family RNA-binding protein